MNGLLYILFLFIFIFQYLLGNDVVLVSGQCNEILFQLRNTLEFNSSLSTVLASWDVKNTDDCCIWNGVICNLASQVIGLDLSHEGISGGINDSSVLFGLESLQRLNLAYNKFNFKPIPSRFGNLTSLVYLNLSNSDFSGEVPQTFSQLTKLEVLDLSYNNNLSIDTFNMSSFRQISSLKLASCNLRNFPDLRNLSNLSYLDLSNNNIGGEIPSWIWGNGSYNGPLVYMNVSHNQLVGLQKPYVFPKHLSILDLHSNWLGGRIPRPPPFVTYIDYSENLFSSSVPENIGHNLTSAVFFSVSRNSLTGPIPRTICNATRLKVLDLSHNGFDSKIPECLFEFGGDLEVLKLGNNNLVGIINGTFASNCGLSVFEVNRNSLVGKIPRSLANCKSLEVLNLGSNQIHDTYPCFLSNNSALRVMILRSNKLYGGLNCNPDATWEKLRILDVAFNDFTGVLSEDWFLNWPAMMSDTESSDDQKHESFMVLQLDEFHYRQTTTVTTTTVKGLEVVELVKILTIFTSMDISNNHFGGEIPSTIGRLKMLYLLDISNNEFIGSIPPSTGDLYQIESLDLSANKLVGEIPFVLTTLSFLVDFDVSYNQLEGRIPVGTQFETFTNGSFEGNTRLCGPPLSKSCKVSGVETTTMRSEVLMSVGLGFVVGLGMLVLPLIFHRGWNRWYFHHVDHMFVGKLRKCYEPRKRTRRTYKNPIQRL